MAENLKNTENLPKKNFEYLLAQQQEAMLKQQQTFLTNLQSILICSRQTPHSMMGSSGSSRQGTNNMSAGSSGSSRQRTNCISLNINQDKSHQRQTGDKRKHSSDDGSYDDDDRLSVTAGHDFDIIVDHQSFRVLYASFTLKHIRAEMKNSNK